MIRRVDLAGPGVAARIVEQLCAGGGKPIRIAEFGKLIPSLHGGELECLELRLTEELAKLWRRHPPGAPVLERAAIYADARHIARALEASTSCGSVTLQVWLPATSYDDAWMVGPVTP